MLKAISQGVVLVCLTWLLSGCATTGERRSEIQKPPVRKSIAGVQELRAQLDHLFADPAFSNAFWGVLIKSLDNSQVLYKVNEHKGFIPASNMKLYTTAAALVRLGTDYQYRTDLLTTDDDFSDGVINGDLYVLGSGDPSFSDRHGARDALAPLESWAQVLKTRGIRRIEGDIIGDDDIFDDEHIAESWYYSYLSNWYAAESGGLTLNENCYQLYLSPGKSIGEPVRWRSVPPAVYGEVIVSATTGPANSGDRVSVSRQVDTNRIQVKGSLGADARETRYRVSIHNPTLFFTTVFKHVLENQGIEVQGQPRDIDDLDKNKYAIEKMPLLASYTSPPLAELVRTVNKPSHNLYADQLLKTLGAKFGKHGSFAEGYEVVKTFLDEQGIDSQGFAMSDGSGLGRVNLVQPRQTVGLLEAMSRQPSFPAFYDSLPIAGVDGTISDRMKGTLAQGNVHAKTGFIHRARSLSGYVTTLDGERLVFCLMVNNYTVPTSLANRLQDEVCIRLANFTRKR